MKFAKRALRLHGEKHPKILGALAAAHVATGQFEQAVRWQKEAIELAPPQEKGDFRRRLELYESATPFRK